ncbi:MAG: sensor histidine kinase [Rikenellaceae bacterium]
MSENLLYGLLWTAIILVPMLNAVMTTTLQQLYPIDVISAWSKVAPYFLIFLINNARLAPLLLISRSYATYVVVVTALVFTIFTLVDYAQEYLLPQIDLSMISWGRPGDGVNMSFTNLNRYWNSLLAASMIVANSAIKLVYKSMRDEQAMGELKQQNMQVEMDYLKYQINPHFFMNTLNNIHALIDIDAESAKSTVIELSKMMRYVLYESGCESISLRQDLQFLTNYIKLMEIRYDGGVEVRTTYPESIPAWVSIPPLLFIVFVENAFKHGVGQGEGCYIHLDVEFDGEDRVVCRVVNSLADRGRGRSGSGIGLENVRRRLELLYDDNFQLDTRAHTDKYSVKLTIPIRR